MTRLSIVALAVAALATHSTPTLAQPAARDPLQEGLPLRPTRTLEFATRTGQWMSLDVSPDGQTLVFDLLGDLYTLPIAGGAATRLTHGMGFDAQPRFSPDGRRVLFVSDRDGGWNLWTISLDKKDTTQLTRGKTTQYYSPTWTTDGKYVVATRGTKLWLYSAEGGTGQQLVRPVPNTGGPNASGPDNSRQLGAVVSRDGRWVWYAQRAGNSGYNTMMGDWQLYAYDRESGRAARRTGRWGSAFRPVLSPDGRWLVYGSRDVDSTRLRIRDLDSGAERWLTRAVQRDDAESSASLDLYPGMAFTPDSKFLLATWNGRLWKQPVDGGAATEIPFEVNVAQPVGPRVKFTYRVSDSTTFVAKQIRDAVPSPDGRRLAFVALDHLYVMDMPAPNDSAPRTPRRLTNSEVGEFEPTWSPDGQWLAYTTWSDATGGALYKVRADGRTAPQRLTTAGAYYAEPAWAPDGRRIVAVRASNRSFDETLARGISETDDLVWVPATGGLATLLAPSGEYSNPHFTRDTTRVFMTGNGRLASMRWDGIDLKTHVRVTGASAGGGDGPAAGSPATVVLMSPSGDQALAQVGSDLFVVTIPMVGGTEPTITVGGTGDATFPVRRLTDIGGQFPAWSRDGGRVHWSIGNAHAVYDLARARAFDDSARLARRAPAGVPNGAPGGAAGAAPARQDSTRTLAFKPFEFRVRVTATRDTPRGVAVLRGARVVTMKGDEVIERADVVVRDNRIVAVGAQGSVEVPNDARVIDVAGKTIIPGYVDTHAHLRPSYEVHRAQVWSYAANLAYGVTTARDPQTATTDVLTYEDQVVAGNIVGPRIYSTGPGIFGGGNANGVTLRTLDDARTVVRRYRDYYDTKTLKQYGVGNREQRQWLIQAAREAGMMPTLEGGLDYRKNITEIVDSYSGLEHTLPTFPTQSDALRLLAFSGTVYTPTLLVAYGGPWSENFFYETENVFDDQKLRRFTPWAELEGKVLRRGGGGQAGWFHPSQYVFKLIGEQVRDLVALGGRVGVGSHGQLQGLGYHWELWSMGSGGLPRHDALRAATIFGAEALGLEQDLGSIEPGKLADLVVLDANPLDDLRNSKALRMVMKNGRLYDAESLDEQWPRQRKAGRFYWAGDQQ